MQGNATVLDALNKLVALELGAVNQYVLHHAMADNWGLSRLAAKTMARARQEMGHAEQLIGRILLLDGVPVVSQLGPINIGATVPTQHSVDLQSENTAIGAYRAAVATATEAGDAGTRLLLDRILTEEEAHASDLEAELDQLGMMGVGPYLAEQI